jgi:hypothetical protein
MLVERAGDGFGQRPARAPGQEIQMPGPGQNAAGRPARRPAGSAARAKGGVPGRQPAQRGPGSGAGTERGQIVKPFMAVQGGAQIGLGRLKRPQIAIGDRKGNRPGPRIGRPVDPIDQRPAAQRRSRLVGVGPVNDPRRARMPAGPPRGPDMFG